MYHMVRQRKCTRTPIKPCADIVMSHLAVGSLSASPKSGFYEKWPLFFWSSHPKSTVPFSANHGRATKSVRPMTKRDAIRDQKRYFLRPSGILPWPKAIFGVNSMLSLRQFISACASTLLDFDANTAPCPHGDLIWPQAESVWPQAGF